MVKFLAVLFGALQPDVNLALEWAYDDIYYTYNLYTNKDLPDKQGQSLPIAYYGTDRDNNDFGCRNITGKDVSKDDLYLASGFFFTSLDKCTSATDNADNFTSKTNPNRTNPCCSGNCWAMNTISGRDNHGFDCLCVAGDTTNDYYYDDAYIKNSGWNIGNNSSIDQLYIAPSVNFDADSYQYWVWCGFFK